MRKRPESSSLQEMGILVLSYSTVTPKTREFDTRKGHFEDYVDREQDAGLEDPLLSETCKAHQKSAGT